MDNNKSYKESREEEYIKIDRLKEEAIAELLCEVRTEKMTKYKKLRASIKEKFPKE